MASVQSGATAAALECVLKWVSAPRKENRFEWWSTDEEIRVLQERADYCYMVSRYETVDVATRFGSEHAEWERRLAPLRRERRACECLDKDCYQDLASLRVATKSIGTPK